MVLVAIRGNFEGARNRVTEGWSRGGGRKLCKEDVGWIVDLNTFLASWSCGLTQWAGLLGRRHLYMACHLCMGK